MVELYIYISTIVLFTYIFIKYLSNWNINSIEAEILTFFFFSPCRNKCVEQCLANKWHTVIFAARAPEWVLSFLSAVVSTLRTFLSCSWHSIIYWRNKCMNESWFWNQSWILITAFSLILCDIGKVNRLSLNFFLSVK